ncbi:uncharacterized protein N7498_005154 [Penicillium cinerascens]|uniref:Uncharacterized protein n=1 Tax=Penicillium cinerascens TaxID=70096 RepID=A0A9W9T0A1_9EURO|nr:uncharacterized protein N7498_005154 [Penicillium cinerascens]KAJ5204275.1 hypothetical protein N7498_005154 [Penicillium cinerascens]
MRAALEWLTTRMTATGIFTRNLLKDRFATGIARTLVTEFRACVSSAFQHSTTYPSADVFRLNILIERTKVRLELATKSLALNGLLFSRAASLGARMTATMQGGLALAETLGMLNITLVTDAHRGVAATLTLNWDPTQTGAARPSMTDLVAGMTTWKHLATWLATVGNWIFARSTSSETRGAGQRRFSTRTTDHNVWRSRTMGGMRVLWMAFFLAEMHTTIEWATAGFLATKVSNPLLFRSIVTDCLAFHLVLLGAAQHFGLHFAAITTSLDRDLTSTT